MRLVSQTPGLSAHRRCRFRYPPAILRYTVRRELSGYSLWLLPLFAIAAQVSQIIQDFGTGSFLLWPLLNIGRDIDKSWSDPPLFRVFLIGATLFLIGWAVRRAFSTKELPTPD